MSYMIRSPKKFGLKVIDKTLNKLCLDNIILISKDEAILDITKSGSSFIKSNLIKNNKCFFLSPLSTHIAQFLKDHSYLEENFMKKILKYIFLLKIPWIDFVLYIERKS